MKIKLTIIVFASLLFTGCMEKYKFQDGEKIAYVENMGLGSVSICKDSTFYDVPLDKKSGLLKVPANERITIMKWVYMDHGYMSYSCGPKASFIPLENQKYIVNLELLQGGCFIEVVKKNDNKVTGVDFEDSLGGVSCHSK
ncbi:hypothetical protein [Kangiella sp. HZ709]|uniref:hypothetical protein n=1 Tax=Kangiella sp. HZ709 TaxID=2666328 RepID=UPI0012B01C80|nr:hypothetical protein [Kangiella sp. HZ709]MRX27366.1 hypothetical protein [Kangiella sp. HZ709]